jgi:superfamily I DNA and RNA helicase
MKTAMQELIELLELDNELKLTMPHLMCIIEEVYIEKEKEKLIHTYWEAYKEGRFSSDRTAEEYYEQTFNPQDDGYSNFDL